MKVPPVRVRAGSEDCPCLSTNSLSLFALHFDAAVWTSAFLKWPQRVAESNSPAMTQPLVLSPGFPPHCLLADECSPSVDPLVVFGVQVMILSRTLWGSWAQKPFRVLPIS